MKLYHGASGTIENVKSNRGMYFTSDIKIAKQYALRLDDMGNFNPESVIYMIEIDMLPTVMDDFEDFDAMGYTNYKNAPEFATSEDYDFYFFVKNPEKFDFVEIERYAN